MQKRQSNIKTVFVGISGGVDSSVAALLLQRQGYEVVGVFIRTWQPDWIECTWRDERRDAMRVCAHLDIPFLECDMTDRYRDDVAGYMIDEYKKGRTPNPDVMCNSEVKFGGFFDWALARGADFIATGHYVKRRALPNGQLLLQRGIDATKDQSYFLWMLTQDQIAKSKFPLGAMQKSEVRKLAQKHHLPTRVKKDSQGVCFLGEIDMKDFLSHCIETKPAKVLNHSGDIMGEYHLGVLMVTYGERLGFDRLTASSSQEALYVIEKNIDTNTIIVGPKNEIHGSIAGENSREKILLEQVNDPEGYLDQKNEYIAHIRYHGQDKNTHIISYDRAAGTAEIIFDHIDRTVSPGQSIVLYDNDGLLVGGGIVA